MQRVVRVLASVALVVGAAACGWGRSPEPPPLVVETSSLSVDQFLTVHVAGAVADPGLVVVPVASRVADAVAAAGGATSDAELGSLNLATLLRDGDHIVIPRVGEMAAAGADAGGRIRLNSASSSELESLPGVGPVTAQRIVDHRTEHGLFATVEDLLDVPGIGEAKLEGLRDAVVVP